MTSPPLVCAHSSSCNDDQGVNLIYCFGKMQRTSYVLEKRLSGEILIQDMSAAGLLAAGGGVFSQVNFYSLLHGVRGRQTHISLVVHQYGWLMATCPLLCHLTNGADWCQQFAAWRKNGRVTFYWPFHFPLKWIERTKLETVVGACQLLLTLRGCLL